MNLSKWAIQWAIELIHIMASLLSISRFSARAQSHCKDSGFLIFCITGLGKSTFSPWAFWLMLQDDHCIFGTHCLIICIQRQKGLVLSYISPFVEENNLCGKTWVACLISVYPPWELREQPTFPEHISKRTTILFRQRRK